ncbi:hypothetical protein K466DRAFT_579695 [Polyporus arcularius HHB13444]|uniref:HSF-type DNA-binding domain-containing protein n=1 Tax=Polyporus arcularius HHB13444 TaxID=1314778 RepID=A0A5C3Q3M5_9APHY|nr:hypothetical protein K466DRAFT_579695 [Polyporus arcularius HHB13444]
MSQATQVAIAGSSALQPTTKASIPRFLLKLYEILSDPANEHLIKWSEAGDSFYIYNQDRFAREVLGKWFKHQNFSSFVRQLNLYGFRKISALQQGLLRMDNDETIQFAHPYFHRGQPDLLALIQRKRHPANHAEDGPLGLLQAPPSQDGKLQAQAVDVRSIVEGINTIRRQQQAISAELSALKQSNDALWKDAIEARERHAKHEDTINRILKFLAGLFGRVLQGEHGQSHEEANSAPRRRLLIGDGRTSHGEGADYFGDDFEGNSDTGSRAHTPFSVASDRFATVETPSVPNDSPALTAKDISQSKSPPKPVKSEPRDADAPATVSQNAPSPESMWQAALQQMMSSPSHFQRLMQMFANAQYNLPAPTDPSAGLQGLLPPVTPSAQQLTYPALAYAAQHQPQSHAVAPAYNANPLYDTSLSLASAPPPAQQDAALLGQSDRLNKAYSDASEINADMDALQSNIHTLIRDMGLDPNNPSFPSVGNPTNSSSTGTGALPASSSLEQEPWSFDSWLSQVNGAGLPDLAYPPSPGKDGGEDFSAFLDIPFDAPPLAAAPAPGPGPGPAVSLSPAGVKRKLDVVEIPESPPATKKRG